MYVKFIGSNNKSLTKDKIYKVLSVSDNYYYSIKDDYNVESIYEPHLFKVFALLKVKYVGNDNFSLIKDNIYDVISIETLFYEDDTYRIIDETEEDYLFSKNDFEIIENNLNKIY